jgi:hypothetical protein
MSESTKRRIAAIGRGETNEPCSIWNNLFAIKTASISISRSTSRSVRCSRERYSTLGFRRGSALALTVNFSLAGVTKVRCAVAAILPECSQGNPRDTYIAERDPVCLRTFQGKGAVDGRQLFNGLRSTRSCKP